MSALRTVAEIRRNYPTDSTAMKAIAPDPDFSPAQTVRTWVRKALVDGGRRPGMTAEKAKGGLCPRTSAYSRPRSPTGPIAVVR
ncbi:hypothetical protein [Streptomyces sp. CO7]